MKVDADLSHLESGVWRPFQDAEFLLAHISSVKFQRALAKFQQPYRRKLAEGTLDPKINQDIVCKAMAEGLVLDWRGNMVNSAGEPVKYSAAAAARLLVNNPELRDWVASECATMATFNQEELQDLGEG